MDNCPCCWQPLPPAMELTVSLDENCVMWKGIRCDLTPTETEYMHVLAKRGPLWSQIGAMVEAVYGWSEPVTDKCVRVHLSNIRRKLKAVGIPVEIEPQGQCGAGTNKYRLRYA